MASASWIRYQKLFGSGIHRGEEASFLKLNLSRALSLLSLSALSLSLFPGVRSWGDVSWARQIKLVSQRDWLCNTWHGPSSEMILLRQWV